MAALWTESALADLESQDIEPAIVQHALVAPDEIQPGPPLIHALRYWDLRANREMWVRVRIGSEGAMLIVLGANKEPVYPE